MAEDLQHEDVAILSAEHRQQSGSLKRNSWVVGIVSAILGGIVVIFGWGLKYGNDQARMEAKIDLVLYKQEKGDLRMVVHEMTDSMRWYGQGLVNKKNHDLHFMVGRRFNFNDKYFEVLQQ